MSQINKQYAAKMKKSSVAHTCNQLSLFLKEKGCLRDLHIGINAKSDHTAGKMTVDLLGNMESNQDPQTEKLTNLKPEVASFESKASQMTIFYDGQVIVLDDIPADRARDLMSAAGITGSPRVELATQPSVREPVHLNDVREPVRVNGLDLPIARRASLHKFLAKRKDRAVMRAPYPVPEAGPIKHEHNFDLNL